MMPSLSSGPPSTSASRIFADSQREARRIYEPMVKCIFHEADPALQLQSNSIMLLNKVDADARKN